MKFQPNHRPLGLLGQHLLFHFASLLLLCCRILLVANNISHAKRLNTVGASKGTDNMTEAIRISIKVKPSDLSKTFMTLFHKYDFTSVLE